MSAKILMVDDDPKSIQVLGGLLQNNDYKIEFASSGKAALDLMNTDTFDLILLDIIMPDMDGYEVATIIRSNEKFNYLPIIFLTAKTDQESIVKGFEVGGQDYISKPFQSKELLARIKTQINLKQSRSSLKKLNDELKVKVKDRIKELENLNAELNKSQLKYQYALEAANDGIWDWDLVNNNFEFSSGLYRMLQYEPDEFPKLRSEINSRIHPDDFNKSDENELEEFKNSTSDYYLDEFRMKTKSGSYILVRVNGKVVERDQENKAKRVIGAFADVSKNKRKNLDILKAVLKTEDTERSKISQDIHDGIQQTLTISALNFTAAKKAYDKKEQVFEEKFNTGFEYLQKAIVESRELAHTIMPKAIVDYGLIRACESVVEQLNTSTAQTEFSFSHNFTTKGLENHQIEIIIFRILQEALNNVVKYAKATTVDVQLKNYDDLLLLTVEDNGIGFDLEKVTNSNRGFGFKSMQNRLDAIFGSLDIETSPGRGTTIIAQIEKNKILDI